MCIMSAMYVWQDVCRQLVENYNLSPSDESHASASLAVFYCARRPLHWACEYGRLEVVKYLLTLPPVMVTVNERNGGGGGYECP